MSVTLQIARKEDLSAIIDLANRVFRSRRPGHFMQEEFPYLYDEANADHWYLAKDHGRVVGMVGAMVWPAVIAGASTRVASIGSVATHEDYRRRGLATNLLTLSQKALVQESVRMILISGHLPIYQRFGGRAVGKVQWYTLRSNSPLVPYQIRPIHPHEDSAVIARLYQTRSTRFGRTLSQLQAMLTTQPITTVEQGTKVAELVLDQGQPVSYFIVNHHPFGGKDTSRLVEWGGDPKGVMYGLSQLVDGTNGEIRIPVLPEDLALRGHLYPSQPVQTSTVSWLAKIIDGPGLFSDLSNLVAELSADPVHISQISHDQYEFRWGDSRQSMDAATLTEWTFGHHVATRPSSFDILFPFPALWPEGLNYI